jgi:hypothetical protein
MSKLDSIVVIYETHKQAELAVKDLEGAGVDMKSLSIAAKDTHRDEQVVGHYNRSTLWQIVIATRACICWRIMRTRATIHSA